jgi:hypothetical protein
MRVLKHHKLPTLVVVVKRTHYAEYGYALAITIKEVINVITVLFHYVVDLIAIVAWPTDTRAPT